MTIHRQTEPKARSLRTIAAAITAVGLLALAGCGSSSSGGSSASTPTSTPTTTAAAAATGTTATTSTTATTNTTTTSASTPVGAGPLKVEANPEGQLAYSTPKALSAKAGKVSIDFTNMSPVGHNMTVESASGKILGATPTFQGATKTLTLDLKPGTYKFFCSVPGHRMAGMEGTLTVK